jgi:hypothetical protein
MAALLLHEFAMANALASQMIDCSSSSVVTDSLLPHPVFDDQSFGPLQQDLRGVVVHVFHCQFRPGFSDQLVVPDESGVEVPLESVKLVQLFEGVQVAHAHDRARLVLGTLCLEEVPDHLNVQVGSV